MNKEIIIKDLPDFLFTPEFIKHVYNNFWYENLYLDDDQKLLWFKIASDIVNGHAIFFRVKEPHFTSLFIECLSQVQLVKVYKVGLPPVIFDLILEIEGITLPRNFIGKEFIKELLTKYHTSIVSINNDFNAMYFESGNPELLYR